MSGHICLSFHVVVGAYVLTILCSPAMSHWRTTYSTKQQLHQEHRPRIWQRKPAGYVQPAAAGAPAACVAYGTSGPCHVRRRQTTEQQVIDHLVGFDHDNYRSIANGCWLTNARVYCQCGCPIYRHIHEEMAPDFFHKFTGKTRPCGQTILYRFQCQFQFRRVGLSANWIVGELVRRRVGLSVSCPVTPLCKDTSDDRNVTVVLTVRTNVEYQIKLTSKLQNVQCRQHEAILNRRSRYGCESSYLCLADTASIDVAWEASSTEYCRCYGSNAGKQKWKDKCSWIGISFSIVCWCCLQKK